MRKCCLLPFLLLILIGSNAQDLSTQYRMVGKDDIGMTRYDKDPSAEAVVLHDYGKSSIVFRDQGFIVYYERTTRIKIFSEAGLRWANVEIPIYQEGGIYEKVFELEACTYNLTDGNLNRKQLDPENCHEEKLNEFWNVLKFAMPDVREGSVIEYKYTISSQYMFNLRDWEFQWRIPVVYSEYEVHMVPFYTYTWLLQGASKFDVYTSYIDKNLPKSYGQAGRYYDMIYKFGMRDMPAFRDEEFITSINDYIIKLDFQLSSVHDPYGSVYNIISTWPDMIEELLKHDDFGKYIKKSEKLANKLVDIDMISHMSPPERFNTIINYVKGNYNWNKINSKYAHKPVNDLLADKYGNNAEINLFLTGLLRAAGLEAYPVILSTREHGKIKYDYPFSHFFNYVLVWVKLGNGNVLADATDIMNANDRIPARCINDKGLIIKEGSVDWISLECNTSSEQNYALKIDLTEDRLTARVWVTTTDYEALYYRNAFREDREKIKEQLKEKGYHVEDSTIVVKNALEFSEPYQYGYVADLNAEIINDKLYIAPFLKETITENPLKSNRRDYPVDMIYPSKKSYRTIMDIPEGYDISYIPADYRIRNSMLELEYTTERQVDNLIITFNYYFKQSVYSPGQYDDLKFYFREIVNKGNDRIVLVKRTDL